MKPTVLPIGVIAAFVMAGCGSGSALADLPSLTEKPWLDYFLVSTDRDFTFSLNNWAQGSIIPVGKGGKELSIQLRLPVIFFIEEVLPSGATVTKKILPETLESKNPATLKPTTATFRGKVTGDASFEAHVEVDRDTISVGGRLLDPGTLTKNPLRFGVRITVPEAYRNAKKTEKDDAKEFAKKIKDDRYAVVWTDGKKAKFNGGDKIEADPKKVNGPGIAELKVEIGAYQDKALEFTASGNSKIALWTRLEQPFSEGFSINWYPDPAKDPETKARLKFTVK